MVYPYCATANGSETSPHQTFLSQRRGSGICAQGKGILPTNTVHEPVPPAVAPIAADCNAGMRSACCFPKVRKPYEHYNDDAKKRYPYSDELSVLFGYLFRHIHEGLQTVDFMGRRALHARLRRVLFIQRQTAVTRLAFSGFRTKNASSKRTRPAAAPAVSRVRPSASLFICATTSRSDKLIV